jgi:D-2-hydroxyacid dehydrogenase (NADP+)
MIHILILLTLPEQVRQHYLEGVSALSKNIKVSLVDHHSKVDPFIETADILITFGPMMAEHVLEKAKRLQWIQALGTGVDGITNRPSLGKGVTVTNLHGIHGPPVSEAALSMMFALSRGLWRVYENQLLGKWEKKIAPTLLHGKTVVIYGTGVIAAELAPKCKALGMRVIGISTTVREIDGFDEVHTRQDALGPIAQADYLVLLTPYTPETHGIINEETFSVMKRSSYLINLARGGVVHEGDLIKALNNKTIQAAALDVFEQEPLPAEHVFWGMRNVIVTPHEGGFYDGYVQEAIPVIQTNLQCFERGDFQQMINVVRVAHATSS